MIGGFSEGFFSEDFLPSEKVMSLIFRHYRYILTDFRSDAQRAAKQKEAKERELEAHSFNADRIEEGGFPVSMVTSIVIIISF